MVKFPRLKKGTKCRSQKENAGCCFSESRKKRGSDYKSINVIKRRREEEYENQYTEKRKKKKTPRVSLVSQRKREEGEV